MIDQSHAAQPLDAFGEGLDRDRISGHRDRHVAHHLRPVVSEFQRGFQDPRDESGVGVHAFTDKVRCALCVADLVRSEEAVVLFDGPHDVERWDVRCRRGAIEMQKWRYGGPPERNAPDAPRHGERYAILAVRRGDKVTPMNAAFKLQAGDVASIMVHELEREEAEEQLKQMGWEREQEAQAA